MPNVKQGNLVQWQRTIVDWEVEIPHHGFRVDAHWERGAIISNHLDTEILREELLQIQGHLLTQLGHTCPRDKLCVRSQAGRCRLNSSTNFSSCLASAGILLSPHIISDGGDIISNAHEVLHIPDVARGNITHYNLLEVSIQVYAESPRFHPD